MKDSQETFALPPATSIWQRPIPVAAIILLALAIHGPLLVMELPATTSYDANLHIFFASHYAHHWFNPWNEKWFGGFSQTTYPPLTHQWIALLSYIVGLTEAFMLVQLAAVVLLAVGAYRFAQLWVDDRAASYAGVLAVFAGSIAFLVYSAGQLPTTMSAPLYFLSSALFIFVVQVGQLAIAAEGSCSHAGCRIGPSRHADLRLRSVCPAGVVAGVVRRRARGTNPALQSSGALSYSLRLRRWESG